MEEFSKKQGSSGILLHVTSLPGPYGIGEIGNEAKDFVDSLSIMNQQYWQILPTNYPERHNSPYDTNSAFAQNPFLISLDGLIEDGLLSKAELEPIPEFLDDRVEFEKLKKWKQPLLRKAATNFSHGHDKDLMKYREFCEEQSFWLKDYAIFMVLKEMQNKKDWSYWKSKYRKANQDINDDIEFKNKNEIEEKKILQYLFHKQWKELKTYANDKGIKLIGDIPIYISFNSADVWTNQDLFKLDENCKMQFQSGVPPDHFMETGQLWGHPTYDWEKHENSDFSWWVNRINHTMQYVDMIRIDHFNGFAKYWEVPIQDLDATEGRWMKAKGIELLKEVFKKNDEVNLIAEDLGEASSDAAVLRNKYNIPGMSVLQFLFYDGNNINDIEEDTILYTGTHDNDTSIGWYKSLKEKLSINEIDGLKNVLNSYSKRINWSMIEYSFQSRATTVIVPVQDILGLGSDARMNTPGTISEKNWSWRMTGSELDDTMLRKMRHITEKAHRT
tara:strand:+ start:9241 stop:10743 length:1503 start_codon:yes stop_codon:yes gene_type:complete